MDIKEFVKTLDPEKVYYAHFKDTDTLASIYQNRLIFADGSGNTINKNIMFFDDNTIIYDAEKAHCYQGCNKNNQIYPDSNPMPELENGMFVKRDGYVKRLGVVVNNSIIYDDGKYSELKYALPYIVAVYGKAVRCFNQCVDYNIIWRKNND